jgi:phosphonate transport system substrate-binding protein
MDTLILGAVAYDPKVVTIWDGFQTWFARRGLAFDIVLYTNYERQVRSASARRYPRRVEFAVGVARNPARGTGVRQACRGDRHARHRSGPDQSRRGAQRWPDNAGRAAWQAGRRRRGGLTAGDAHSARGSRWRRRRGGASRRAGRQARRSRRRRTRRRACARRRHRGRCVHARWKSSGVHARWHVASRRRARVAPDGRVRSLQLHGARRFTVLDDAPASIATFRELLLGMSYEDPDVRPLLDLEGLRAWRPGRVSGYAALERAVATSGYLEPWLTRTRARAGAR